MEMGNMKRSLQMDIGIMEEKYTNVEAEHYMNGKSNGKGDVAKMWAMCSHLILNMFSDF